MKRQESSKGEISPEFLYGGRSGDNFQYFQTSKMAALVKKAPALLAAAKELATPKLNTFLRYAKVGIAEPNQYFLINTSFKG